MGEVKVKTVKLPASIELTIREGVTQKVDISGWSNDALVYACLYKFGGIADANAGCKTEADARKASKKRVDRLAKGDVPKAGGFGTVRHHPVWDIVLARFGTLLGWNAKERADERKVGMTQKSVMALAYRVAVRRKGKGGATKAMAEKIAEKVYTDSCAEYARRLADAEATADIDALMADTPSGNTEA